MYNLSEKAIAEKYEDLLFTKVMALYAAEESEKILSEIENEEPADPKNIEKIYSKTERRENFSTLWKVSKKLITFAAMVVFVAVVSLSSVVVASAEAREAVAEAIYHLVLRKTDRYTEVSIGNSTGFIDPELYNWEGAYAPTYMPEGFELSNFDCTLSQQSVDYICGEDFIYFIQARNSTGQIDTENAEIVENLIIGDSSALFVVKDNITQVSWSVGDTMFLICATANPEEVLKVAKSIKPIGYFKTEEPEGEYTFIDPELYDWEGAYAPTYVPEGFVLEELSKNKSQKIAKYFSDNAYISFSQAYNVVKQIDTENAERNEDIQIGDSTGLLVVNDEITYVLWNIGDTVFHIYGTCETDEIIKMAKGIKPLGKTETEEPTEKYEFIDPEIYTWDNAYGMTYVPETYYLKEYIDIETERIITYSDKNNEIIFSQATDATVEKIDTENADITKEIQIGESVGLFVVKNNVTIIAWSNEDFLFEVIGTAPTEEIIKIAEGIRPIS